MQDSGYLTDEFEEWDEEQETLTELAARCRREAEENKWAENMDDHIESIRQRTGGNKMNNEQTTALGKALLNAQKAVETLTKESRNNFHKYNYVSCEAMIRAARECLGGAGLTLITLEQELSTFGIETSEPILMCKTVYQVTHEEGGYFTAVSNTPVVIEKGKPADKAMAAAKSLDLAYFLRNLLLIDKEDKQHAVDARDDNKYQPTRINRRKS